MSDRKERQTPIITIDGPSGSGKGTVAQIVAHRLGWHYLDSGSLYRVLAFAAIQKQISIDDEGALAEIARGLDVEFTDEVPAGAVLEGADVSDGIRSEESGIAASKLSVLPRVREALLQRQRDFAQPPGLVTDGRDMGTVVFPEASLKVFLTGSCEERAKRRHNQLKEKGINVSLSQVLRDLKARDARDQNRAIAPMEPAPDAAVIDTTDMTIEQVVAKVMSLRDDP